MEKLIIIGSGPAGISAALYAARAGLDPLILSQGVGALEKAEWIENYYGVQPVTGRELHEQGEQQAKALGARLVRTEVLGLSGAGPYIISTTSGDYEAIAVILAAGTKRKTLPIAGLTEMEGHGVSYCAVCDGFFYRDKPVGVLGNGDFAYKEAEALSMAASVTIFTNGLPPAFSKPCSFTVEQRPVEQIVGEQNVEGVRLADGTLIPLSGIFVALGTAGSSELARHLGVPLDEKGNIVVDAQMATVLPGLYAAGDCTGGVLQISKAVADGRAAAVSSIQYIREYYKKQVLV